jgi:leucyl aminopeptidase
MGGLKHKPGMVHMKCDMAGGAARFGADSRFVINKVTKSIPCAAHFAK